MPPIRTPKPMSPNLPEWLLPVFSPMTPVMPTATPHRSIRTPPKRLIWDPPFPARAAVLARNRGLEPRDDGVVGSCHAWNKSGAPVADFGRGLRPGLPLRRLAPARPARPSGRNLAGAALRDRLQTSINQTITIVTKSRIMKTAITTARRNGALSSILITLAWALQAAQSQGAATYALWSYSLPLYPGNYWIYQGGAPGSDLLRQVESVSDLITCFTGRANPVGYTGTARRKWWTSTAALGEEVTSPHSRPTTIRATLWMSTDAGRRLGGIRARPGRRDKRVSWTQLEALPTRFSP